MRRISCDERADWRETAERVGFVFHTIDGERYWDESAYYGFTLKQIEARPRSTDGRARRHVPRSGHPRTGGRGDDAPAPAHSAALLELACNELQARRPEPLWPLRSAATTAKGRAKLLEYNADTPTSAFETGVFQWLWLEDVIERQIVPKDFDQYNSLHERLIEGWKADRQRASRLHLTGMIDDPEDSGTIAYLEDSRAPGRPCHHPCCRSSWPRPEQGRALRRRRECSPGRAPVQALSLGMDDARSSSALRCPVRRPNSSNRPGRRSCPTRESCRCCGRCFRVIPICCRPTSKVTRRPRPRFVLSVRKPLYSREGANVEPHRRRAASSTRTAAPMVRRDLSGRALRRSHSSTATTWCSDPGSPPANLAASRCARI